MQLSASPFVCISVPARKSRTKVTGSQSLSRYVRKDSCQSRSLGYITRDQTSDTAAITAAQLIQQRTIVSQVPRFNSRLDCDRIKACLTNLIQREGIWWRPSPPQINVRTHPSRRLWTLRPTWAVSRSWRLQWLMQASMQPHPSHVIKPHNSARHC